MANLPPDDDATLACALFRYRLIAEAVSAPREARAKILAEVAAAEHVREDGARVRVSRRTLGRWLARYEKDKLAGLLRRPRRDRGKLRALSPAALARAMTLRQEEPARSTPTLIDILEREGSVAAGAVKRSTLDRHLDEKDASRRRLGALGAKRHVKLAFEHPLDFVVGDFHVGPYVRAAGAQKSLFEPDAVTLVFQHSRGIPRLAQNLALGALMAAASANKKLADTDCVQQALLDQEAP